MIIAIIMIRYAKGRTGKGNKTTVDIRPGDYVRLRSDQFQEKEQLTCHKYQVRVVLRRAVEFLTHLQTHYF